MAANTMPGSLSSDAARPVAYGQPAQAPSSGTIWSEPAAHQFDITKLRQDVLRQVTASLAAFVGSVSYSAHGHAAMAQSIAGGKHSKAAASEPEPEEKDGAKALFDREK